MRIPTGIVSLAAALLASAVSVFAHTPRPAQEEVTGTLEYLWEDYPGGESRLRLDVAAADGRRWELRFDGGVPSSVHALAGRRVRVRGRREPRPGGTPGLLRVRSIAADGPAPARAAAAETGRRRMVTLLCQFSDQADVPHPAETYRRWTGPGRPGMEDYWREVSGGRVQVVSAGVHGWRRLPRPTAYYLSPLNARAMVNDCTALFDDVVDFSQVDAINVQVSAVALDKPSGAGIQTLELDGVAREFRLTFLMGYATQAIYAHEIGHTFGMLHSFGAAGQAYQSPWDVMGVAGQHNAETGEVEAQHPIAFHKEIPGWIDPGRKVVPARGSRQVVELAGSALPGAEGAVMVEVPVEGDAVAYTVEARPRAGYDRNLPDAGVILHRKLIYAPTGTVYAQLVSRTTNSRFGAVWKPGEAFADSVAGVGVAVLAATEGGYRVEVRRGWALEVTVQGSGAVKGGDGGLDCAEACTRMYAARGETAALRAEPAPGWAFAGWSGACTGAGTCTVTLNGDRRVQARFVRPGDLAIASDSARPAGVMGAAYRDSLEATGGLAVEWALESGRLPAGVQLDAGRGVLSGVPEEAGTFRFVLVARGAGAEARRQFVLAVTEPVLSPGAVVDHLLGGSGLRPDEARYLDLQGNRNGRYDVGDLRAWLQRRGTVSP